MEAEIHAEVARGVVVLGDEVQAQVRTEGNVELLAVEADVEAALREIHVVVVPGSHGTKVTRQPEAEAARVKDPAAVEKVDRMYVAAPGKIFDFGGQEQLDAVIPVLLFVE